MCSSQSENCTNLEKTFLSDGDLATMEKVHCLLCGSEDFEVFFKLENQFTKQPEFFNLVQCNQCNLVYLNPRPVLSAMETYYTRNYGFYISLSEQSSLIHRWLVRYGLWKRCRPLLKNKPPGKILDIGCGRGSFLVEMRKHGWEPVGVEPNPYALAIARDVMKVEVYDGRFGEVEFPESAFDAITMWDCLEHIHNPSQALRDVLRILKPGGYLLLRVPSLDSLDANLFGPYWAGLDPPRHLVVFSRATLVRFLRKAGFKVERLWCLSGSHASFVLSLQSLLQQWEGAVVLRSVLRVLLATLSSPVGKILSWPYFFVIDKLTLGPEIAVLAKKRNGGS